MDTPEQSTQNIPESRPSSYLAYEEEESISLLDILLVIARNRRLIGITTALFLALGLLIAVFSPNEYTASARMIRETQTESGGGLAGGLAALRGLGISVGGGSVGLTAETYPDILRSREVRLAIARSEFHFEDVDGPMTLVDYYSRDPGIVKLALTGIKKVTIGLPGTIMGMFRDKTLAAGVNSGNGNLQFLTEEEEETIERLGDMVSVNVDRNSGLMTISVTTRQPLLSAQLAQTFINHLTKRVREIYTKKAQEDLEFIRERFGEAQQQLEVAEEKLAQFMDRNRNPQTAQLLTEMERLQRQVTFKTQLYSDLQTQLMQSEIEFQRSQPVITLLEAPVPPLEKSGPKRKMIVIICLMLGLFAGVGLAYIVQFINNLGGNKSQEQSLEEIKAILDSSRWLGKLISLFRR